MTPCPLPLPPSPQQHVSRAGHATQNKTSLVKRKKEEKMKKKTSVDTSRQTKEANVCVCVWGGGGVLVADVTHATSCRARIQIKRTSQHEARTCSGAITAPVRTAKHRQTTLHATQHNRGGGGDPPEVQVLEVHRGADARGGLREAVVCRGERRERCEVQRGEAREEVSIDRELVPRGREPATAPPPPISRQNYTPL